MRTPICDRLEIEFPIFAFSHCRDVVAAVTNAGGFGVLGALAFEPERLQVELDWIEAHVDDRPYGVDFAMPAKYVGQGGGDAASPEMLTAAIPDEYRTFVNQLLDDADIPPVPEGLDRGPTKATGLNVDAEGPGQVEVALGHEGVRMIVNALGPPPPYVVERAHESDILVGALVGAPQHAERQLNIGVDVVIAEGTEAGGHCGEISSMVLVPQIVDTVGDRAHVLAAGGIADGRQMAAAMALGAEGVWCGSVWLLTNEADMYPEVTENLIAATSRDAVRSRAMTGKPARQLRTRWTDAWEQPDAPQPLPMPLQGILYAEAASRFSRVHSREFAGHPAGQIVGSLDRVRPSRQVVTDMVEQWIDAVERLRTMLDDSQ